MPRRPTRLLPTFAVVLLSGLFDEAAHAGFVVDDFAVAQATLADNTTNVPPRGVASQVAGGMLGGFRDLYVNRVEGGAPDSGFDFSEYVTARVAGGRFSLSTPSGIAATAVLRWDGDHGNPMNGLTLDAALATVDGAGLGALDLFAGGDGFRIETRNDRPMDIEFQVFSGANWSSLSRSHATATVGAVSSVFRWPDFIVRGGSGADFSRVGAVQLVVNGGASPALDMELEVVLQSVDAPGSLALAGAALAALAAVQRTRRRRDAAVREVDSVTQTVPSPRD